ncbi:PTS sugar transporter subunit IIA [Lactiplantibacillus pentosus]|uniref:PTS sugar transporter subunit IIA n=1 Tax=Lactiplantibacillus pentosus TaxID=1589 RepID=UPI001B384D46|nr:PTS sugar transporter subunit IIA [Lactiplantibacillus pentosus]MBQ0834964.1 PTS sugar transporter subunit IIA [Lactiplantibacillus pentosus]MBU7464807.1 PTS sugar transporter subunit IIA [Lactiplantibacillus pentosus]MBU7490815.1 PTS sugar transporter subunit IIA [Lactiplantibacillus pentosus]MBU7492937.1 PTS sugar transporter subunit IIA [Lactiplantibacillus pentosus]MBU7518942.1 PTS sugar transporter subunit IIA [Lactiplantibacillus pentosus]
MKSEIRKLVLWDSYATTKSSLFNQVAALLSEQQIVQSSKQVIDLWEQREQMGSTMIDHLLATPHAQADSIKQNTMALVHTRKPISYWDGNEDAQNFIFCCIRQDISKTDADSVTTILRLAISEKAQSAFRHDDKSQIVTILNF